MIYIQLILFWWYFVCAERSYSRKLSILNLYEGLTEYLYQKDNEIWKFELNFREKDSYMHIYSNGSSVYDQKNHDD